MSDLAEYEVDINGITHTLQLNDEDAKRLDAKPKQGAPANKSRRPANKAATASEK